MKCLVVTAHPLADSLCMTLAGRAVCRLTAAGHEVVVEDLYRQGFQPALTAGERQSYYAGAYDRAAIDAEAARLLAADAIVLLFPTWWFGPPAIMKGWFDRVWAPGIAYDHADDFGPIKPRLHRLRRLLAVTTLGAPGWVDRLVMRRPVRRILKVAMLNACAPGCRFEMLSLYKSEDLSAGQVERFAQGMERLLGRWR